MDRDEHGSEANTSSGRDPLTQATNVVAAYEQGAIALQCACGLLIETAGLPGGETVTNVLTAELIDALQSDPFVISPPVSTDDFRITDSICGPGDQRTPAERAESERQIRERLMRGAVILHALLFPAK